MPIQNTDTVNIYGILENFNTTHLLSVNSNLFDEISNQLMFKNKSLKYIITVAHDFDNKNIKNYSYFKYKLLKPDFTVPELKFGSLFLTKNEFKEREFDLGPWDNRYLNLHFTDNELLKFKIKILVNESARHKAARDLSNILNKITNTKKLINKTDFSDLQNYLELNGFQMNIE